MASSARLARATPATWGRRLGVAVASLTSAALAAGGTAFYRRPFATARALRRFRLLASGAAERRVTVRNLPIRYFEAGRSEGTPVVLLHGLGDSAEAWAGVLPALARDHRVIAPDLAGFGRVPIPPEGMHFSVLADYLARFLDALGIERAVLVGNSLGGAVAMRHAARHPERASRLFLLNTAGLPIERVEVFSPRTRAEASELVAASIGARRRLPGFILDDLVRRVGDPARRAYLDSPERTDVSDELHRLTMPLTLIWGERDRLIPLASIAPLREAQPHAELITLPNAGHVPQGDAAREVAAILRERLTEK
jgi:pimeloyl-ACP methyl ester carboxylesterase